MGEGSWVMEDGSAFGEVGGREGVFRQNGVWTAMGHGSVSVFLEFCPVITTGFHGCALNT